MKASIEQAVFRATIIVPKVKFGKPHCAFCRRSETVRQGKGYAFACKLGYIPACADSCPDFKDARIGGFTLNRGFE